MLVLGASVYAPLLVKAGGKLVKVARCHNFAILDLQSMRLVMRSGSYVLNTRF
jgi:hypothetical protein